MPGKCPTPAPHQITEFVGREIFHVRNAAGGAELARHMPELPHLLQIVGYQAH